MAELARRLGYGGRYPETEEELVRFALEGSGFTLEEVRAAGGWVKIPTPMMEYKKWEKGSLRTDGKPGFETPTGKFEIHSTILEDYSYEPLPKYSEPKEGPLANPGLAREYPLVFNSGARLQTDFRSQHHGIERLVRENPEPVVEIHVEDAKARRIETGDLVEVRTERGAVPFRAVVTSDIVQGAVECNMGGGTPVGPKAWREWNANELTDVTNYDEISGFPVYKALLCDVVKIADGAGGKRSAAGKEAGESASAARDPATDPQRPSSSEPELDEPEPERKIYLDSNATTEVADAVREAMIPYLAADHGNPSSIHGPGRDARWGLERARQQVAKLIHARPRRILFTGSGSEADNLALKGVALSRRAAGKHIITSTIEHPAVRETCRFLEGAGYEVTYLDVDETGLVDPAELSAAIRDDTVLVSIMMANNEVGTIQPIKELSGIARERGVLFHTDAVQAAGKIRVDVNELDVDLLSLSGHKFHGPKGVGVLYVRKGIDLEPLIHGGKQESGLRAGTENVPAIVGMGKAAELALQALRDAGRMKALRDRLEVGIRGLISGVKLNGHPEKRLPNTLNLTFPELRGESLVVALDRHGISLSSGSACKSGSPEPTHVLTAMGKSDEEAHCAVRFSLSHTTTEEDVEKTVAAIEEVLEEMETTVRFLPCK
jgi:cysteine desulfurase NifS